MEGSKVKAYWDDLKVITRDLVIGMQGTYNKYIANLFPEAFTDSVIPKVFQRTSANHKVALRGLGK